MKFKKLIEFVKASHATQIRKYTGEPYFVHLQSVAKLAENIKTGKYAQEIAYCHDLIEDTDLTEDQLIKKLSEFGYDRQSAFHIVRHVAMLTDQYTTENFPQLNRAARKKLENKRLQSISALAQSIKCCDIIDNSESIIKYDASFAKVYLAEANAMITNFKQAQSDLQALALKKCG